MQYREPVPAPTPSLLRLPQLPSIFSQLCAPPASRAPLLHVLLPSVCSCPPCAPALRVLLPSVCFCPPCAPVVRLLLPSVYSSPLCSPALCGSNEITCSREFCQSSDSTDSFKWNSWCEEWTQAWAELQWECRGDLENVKVDTEYLLHKIIRVKFSYPVVQLTLGETSGKNN